MWAHITTVCVCCGVCIADLYRHVVELLVSFPTVIILNTIARH